MIFTSVEEFILANKPLKGELLGLDVGTKKTGVAISVYDRALAVSSGIINATSKEDLVNKIEHFAKEKNTTCIVMGFPFGWEEQSSAKWIMQIAQALSNKGVNILLYDEGRTSVKVKNIVYEERGKMSKKQMQNYDSKVAALILNEALSEMKIYL